MQTQINNKQHIIKLYMETVLEQEKAPKSVYKFAKDNSFEESEFYEYFSSFDSLKKHIFAAFFHHAHEVISKNEEYQTFNSKNQLLTFYYTFFEILTANRSYVLWTFSGNQLENLKQLSELKKVFTEYVKGLDIKTIDLKKEAITKAQNKTIEEVAWAQLLMTLKFWKEDTSQGFEKTDLFIEKSIHAGFDLIDISPLKNIIDFGKFLFKEKQNH